MPLPAFFFFFLFNFFFNFTKKLTIRDSGNARARSNHPLSQSFVPRWGMSLHVRLKVKGIHMSIPVPFTWKYPRGPWHISCMSLLGLPADQRTVITVIRWCSSLLMDSYINCFAYFCRCLLLACLGIKQVPIFWTYISTDNYQLPAIKKNNNMKIPTYRCLGGNVRAKRPRWQLFFWHHGGNEYYMEGQTW